jgi:hypothetical protein
MRPGGSLAGVKAFASKLPENAARIAGTLTLLNDDTASVIGPEIFADAVILAQYYLDEASRLVATGAVDPKLREAEQLREWLVARDTDIVGLRAVYQLGPSSIRQADKARAAMKVLEEHHCVRPLPDGAEIDGKHQREAWRVIRA